MVRVYSGAPSDSEPTTSTRSAPRSASITTMGPRPQETRCVRSLAVDAWVSNWDSDVEVDGLVVEVRPLDAHGAVVPVHGVLEVKLIGWPIDITTAGQPPVRLGRWTQLVRPAELGSLGGRYRLPFQSVHPEFNLQWASYGAVCARLSVPGQGVFEATQSSVRIRPYSAVRDHLQQVTGQRFFRVERTGRARR